MAETIRHRRRRGRDNLGPSAKKRGERGPPRAWYRGRVTTHDVDDAGLAELAHASPDLVDLVLAGKRATTLTDDGLAPLAGLHRLRRLRITGAKRVRGPGLAHLAGLPLETLDLGGCGLGPDAVEPLTRLRGLQSLSLARCKQLRQADLVTLLAVGLPIQDADALDRAKDALAEQRAAAVPARSFYLLDAYDNAGFAHYRVLHLSSDLDEIAHALSTFIADADTSAMSIELRVYESSKRVSRKALRPPWKLPHAAALRGPPLAAGESTAVRDPGDVPLVLRHGVNEG